MLFALLLFSGLAFGQAPVDERCPGTALDRAASLMPPQSLDDVKEAVRKSGHGRLVFRLTVSETGEPQSPEVIHPAELKKSEPVLNAIRNLKFCPAVKYNQHAASTVRFDIAVDRAVPARAKSRAR